MNFIKKWWKKYCDELDALGFSRANKRSCVPLDERAQKAIKKYEQDE
ncbi:MAG: hypothetical protein V7782_09765 [Psychromonas sp.]